MAQISLYIEDSLFGRLNAAAKSKNCSISKFVAALVNENLSKENDEETYKKRALMELLSMEPDPTWVKPSEIPQSAELPRKWDLI